MCVCTLRVCVIILYIRGPRKLPRGGRRTTTIPFCPRTVYIIAIWWCGACVRVKRIEQYNIIHIKKKLTGVLEYYIIIYRTYLYYAVVVSVECPSCLCTRVSVC